MPVISIGDYRVKVTKHNNNNCYIGEFMNTDKFPIIYGDTVKEIEDTALEYIVEEENKEKNE